MDSTSVAPRSRRGLRTAFVLAVTTLVFGVFSSPAWALHTTPGSNQTGPVVDTTLLPNNTDVVVNGQAYGKSQNPSCQDPTTEVKFDPPGASGGPTNYSFQSGSETITGTVEYTSTAGSYSFTITGGAVARGVIMKGGSGANIYDYSGANEDGGAVDNGVQHDDGLVFPQGASHISFCLIADSDVQIAPVTFRSFTASRTAKAVTLRWKTGSEIDMLGYNVYVERNGKRVKLNRSLIAGKGLLGGSYAFKTKAPSAKKPVRYWLEALDLDGARTFRSVLAR